jgi:hypothetical protein
MGLGLMLLAPWLVQLPLTARTASDVLSSSGRRPKRWATGELDRSATLSDSPGRASDQAEPFGEPTWTGFRRQSATPSHCLGWSTAQWALQSDAQRCLESDWGSRGRRFKSGRPDGFSNACRPNWERNSPRWKRSWLATPGNGMRRPCLCGRAPALNGPGTRPRGRCRRPGCRQEAPDSGGVDGRRRCRYCAAESACIRGSSGAGPGAPWLQLVFPVWVLQVSINIVVLSYRNAS